MINKMFFFKTDDQLNLIAKHNLNCVSEVGPTTYITQITEDSIQILLLVAKKNGHILQKWTLVDGVCVSISINEPDETTIDCDSGSFDDNITCSNDNHLKCFLCERNK